MPKKDLLKVSMTGEVISQLISDKKKSQQDVADALGEKKQTLSNYALGKRYPDPEFFRKWQKVYGEDIIGMVEDRLNESSNVDEKPENPTIVKKSTGSAEIPKSAKESVYTYLIEQKDHKLIPATLLTDYTMIPNRLINRHDRDIDRLERENARLERMLGKSEKLVENLEKEVAALRSKATTTKSA
jgi:transcriptional regulator with XRE-family HTH domain